MSEEELQREIISGAFSMKVADCERNIRIQFERLQQENKQLKEVIEEVREYIEKHILATETEEVLLQILDKVNKEPKENKYKFFFDESVQEGLDSLNIRGETK